MDALHAWFQRFAALIAVFGFATLGVLQFTSVQRNDTLLLGFGCIGGLLYGISHLSHRDNRIERVNTSWLNTFCTLTIYWLLAGLIGLPLVLGASSLGVISGLVAGRIATFLLVILLPGCMVIEVRKSKT